MSRFNLTPSQDSQDKITGIVKQMNDAGFEGAGQAFLPTLQRTAKPMLNQIPSLSMNQASQGKPNKLASMATGASTWVVDALKPTAKNVWNLATTGFRVAAEMSSEIGYRNANGGVSESEAQTLINKQLNTEYNRKSKELTKRLASNDITKTQYDKMHNDLVKIYGSPIADSYRSMTEARNKENGFYDWQTGQYKPEATIGDIYNVIDGAIALATIGTGGTAKGTVMQTVKDGIFKNGGDFMLGNLARFTTAEKIASFTGKPVVSKAASVFTKVDGIIAKTIETVPGLREYSNRQIAALGGDYSAKQFIKAATGEMIINAPLRRWNYEAAEQIVESIANDEFFSTPEGQSWLASGASQSVLMAGMLLEGGPIGFVTKLFKKVSSTTKVMMFGDDLSVKFATDIKSLMKQFNLSEDDALLKLMQSHDGAYGTGADHFFSLASKDGTSAAGWDWLTRNMDKVDAFKSINATLFKNKSLMQAAFAGVARDLVAAGKEINIDNVMEHMLKWQKAGEINEIINKMAQTKGLLTAGQRAVVAPWSREIQENLVKKATDAIKQVNVLAKDSGMAKADRLAAQKKAVVDLIKQAQKSGQPWAQHDALVDDMIKSIESAKYGFKPKNIKAGTKLGEGDSIINALRMRESAVAAKKVPGMAKYYKELKELGYVPVMPDNVSNPFVSAAEAADTKIASMIVGAPKAGKASILGISKPVAVAEATKLLGDDVALVYGAKPEFAAVGALIRRLGFGIDDAHVEAYRMITTNAAENIDSIKVGKNGVNLNGVETLNTLRQAMEDPDGGFMLRALKGTATDMRQLSVVEIKGILGVSHDVAKEVQRSIIQAHLDVPIHIRGAGDKLVDHAMRNPLQRYYMRAQGALRYSWNPFFMTQEIVETKILASLALGPEATAMSVMRRLKPGSAAQIDDVVKKMTEYRMLDPTRYGEAATNVVLGKVSANIRMTQKRDLASLVISIGERLGVDDIDTLLTKHSDEIIGIIRPIVQYPERGIINSNFARTMNIMVFPSRYNVKVTGLAIKALAQQRPAVQGAIVRGLIDFNGWLKSDVGLAWQQDYAAEIAVFKWLTPVNSLDWTMKRLSGEGNSMSDVGLVGGLPFGVWTQILSNQGIIDTQTPYVNPKTGDIYDKRIPSSMQGRVAMAITDMLASTFTYPGRTLGLPGKSQLTREVAYRATGASWEDFTSTKYSITDLPPDQQRAQAYWSNRAKELGIDKPTGMDNPPEAVTSAPSTSVNTNLKLLESQYGPAQKFSKRDIREAKVKKSTSSKNKTPVPFNQIVGR